MIAVQRESSVPIHAQIAQGIQLAIARGELRTGDRLPTVRQLAVDLKVNSNTVARVYLELEREGVLQTRRGLGTFVREEVAAPSRVHEQRLVWLCREFVESVSKEGFTLREVRRALAALAKPRGR